MSIRIPLIIDLGSSEVKAGPRSESTIPSLRFPSYIGEPKYEKILRNLKKKSKYKEKYVGDDCDPYLGILKLRSSIKNGMFEEEKDISLVFNHIFSRLNLTPENISHTPLLIAEPLLNPRKNREMISTLLFEKYNIPSLIFAYQPFLSLLSFSSTTGIILESGEGVSQICAICDGYSIPSSFIRSNFGGEDVNEYLIKLLKMRGVELVSDTEKLLIHEIKKKHLGFIIEGKKTEAVAKYILPDLNVIQIDSERYLAPRVLLTPSLVGKNCLGLHKMVATCFEKVNAELREKLLKDNLLKLTGGNSNMKSLNEVLHIEIRELLPNYYQNKIKIKTSQNSRTTSCWNGGNIIAGLGIFKDLLIKKKDWEERGNEILHKQSF